MTHALANTSHALKNKLTARADLYRAIRQFFFERHVTEVETPLLSSFGVTDCHIQNIPAQNRFLQTSPEYAMKRLLADGSGDIFQISKAFRQGEAGKKHNPEFTMLEWYRVGFTHIDLMKEVDDLLQCVLHTEKADYYTYQSLFETFLDINPFTISTADLKQALKKHHIALHTPLENDAHWRDTLLDLLMSHRIEPQLGKTKPVFIYHYPASQAALAKINGPVAERFEAYYKGVELANGFHELTQADEQLTRFKKDNEKRKALGLNEMAIDTRFIAALEKGLPPCAGVAMGIDRLLMLMQNTDHIKDVITYTWENV